MLEQQQQYIALAEAYASQREALIRCAEIAGEDGEAVEAACSGAMVSPTVAEFAIRAVKRLRDDYDAGDEAWNE